MLRNRKPVNVEKQESDTVPIYRPKTKEETRKLLKQIARQSNIQLPPSVSQNEFLGFWSISSCNWYKLSVSGKKYFKKICAWANGAMVD